MVRSDIELLDGDYFRIPLFRPSRKIKFKGISFKNILSRWNNFRLERLKKKLAAQRENLVEMEFSGDQLTPGAKRDKVEKRVLRKTQAIVRLESKINFMENGDYYSEEFINSRAIKLKSLMMKNLVYNVDSLYCVNEVAAEEIMSGNIPDPAADQMRKKIGEDVRRILAEKEQAKKATATPSPTPAPVVDETVSKAETDAAIDETIGAVDVKPVVSNDEIAAAIDSEMQKIKVSGNESTPAKVNKFINDDGTYRLRREDIDEEFRITRFDRSQLPVSEKTPVEMYTEPAIPPFNTTQRKKPDVKPPCKALTPITETKFHEFPKIVMPTIKEKPVKVEIEVEAETERSVPIVVPDRATGAKKPVKPAGPSQIEVTVEVEDYGDPGTLIARVNLLRAEKQTIDNMAEAVQQKATSVDAAHRDMMRRLADYADSLEADCNASYQTMSLVEKNAATKEAQINAMIEIMAAVPQSTTDVKRRAK